MISPCVRLCTLDPDDDTCVGCGRTRAEIGGWTRYSDVERQSIIDALPGRVEARRAMRAWPVKDEARA